MLNTPEVAALFSHPLRSLLSSTPPSHDLHAAPHHSQFVKGDSDAGSAQAPAASLDYHTYEDVTTGPYHTLVRIHRFLTGREPDIKPLFGLTAAILVRVAVIGYGPESQPEFDLEAPGQLGMKERISFAMNTAPALVDACKTEGIEVRRVKQIWKQSHLPTRSKL